jgi:plastocyanin
VTKGTTITVANVGSTEHTFTVTRQSIDIENQAGQSQQVAINLTPGTYPFICRFHVNEGMKGR